MNLHEIRIVGPQRPPGFIASTCAVIVLQLSDSDPMDDFADARHRLLLTFCEARSASPQVIAPDSFVSRHAGLLATFVRNLPLTVTSLWVVGTSRLAVDSVALALADGLTLPRRYITCQTPQTSRTTPSDPHIYDAVLRAMQALPVPHLQLVGR